MQIVVVSDTHLRHFDTPPGDLLLHCGDFTMMGRRNELRDFNKWLEDQPQKYKVVIPGNHERDLDNPSGVAKIRDAISDNAELLVDQESMGYPELGLRIWGSPWTPTFGYGWAWNCNRADIGEKWAKIPEGIDILMTHGPAHGVLDFAENDQEHVGCKALKAAIQHIKPSMHFFGHIHESSGMSRGIDPATLSVNASICDLNYRATRKPWVFVLNRNDGGVWEPFYTQGG